MSILVVSDLHGDLPSVWKAIEQFQPEGLLCCGDWGDPEELARADLEELARRLPVLTTFGNHDPLGYLGEIKNRDGSPILLGQGEVREWLGLKVAAIGGIWAKSHRLPHYVTDEDVARYAAQIAREQPVDILITHGCPVGLADLTPSGRHGGQRCFLNAFNTIEPRLHLCGHLHVAQERALRDGRKVINVGATPEGSVAVIEGSGDTLSGRLARLG
jgi:uncharacterized protein